ncbi:MAG: hypothetical protein EZS28_030777 [Streblomastix strix]|uniref:Uncharacterized protein n=1 Tax=Streblomastix strix TaxID=222440 RepID=A0A5J4UTF6_9EUKA|nr:MAG: hypothetical protein EZS28_030777 [Streblomastix strix]
MVNGRSQIDPACDSGHSGDSGHMGNSYHSPMIQIYGIMVNGRSQIDPACDTGHSGHSGHMGNSYHSPMIQIYGIWQMADKNVGSQNFCSVPFLVPPRQITSLAHSTGMHILICGTKWNNFKLNPCHISIAWTFQSISPLHQSFSLFFIFSHNQQSIHSFQALYL